MKTLIVHAHPEPRSFCSSMKDTAVETLRRQGHEVTVSDLYAQAFNPVASAADFESRAREDYLVYALEQRHSATKGTLAPDIAAELDKVLRADLLILNFPIFWVSVPAMLKGWIDRVLVSGKCYGGKRFYDRGGLVGKRAALSFTIGGQRHMFVPGGIHGPLEPYLLPLERGTLAYMGIGVLPAFTAWHVPYVNDEARGQTMDDYRRWLIDLPHAQPKRLPSMSEYDEALRPLNGGVMPACG
jgi:NAD(P)H dehydrogenase (quinone)